jgi:hypothetical protein
MSGVTIYRVATDVRRLPIFRTARVHGLDWQPANERFCYTLQSSNLQISAKNPENGFSHRSLGPCCPFFRGSLSPHVGCCDLGYTSFVTIYAAPSPTMTMHR